MRLLVVSPVLPYRGVPHAGGQFLRQHLCALARNAEVRLVAPATPENAVGLQDVPDEISVVLVPLEQEPDRARRWWDARIRGPRPPSLIRRCLLPVVQEEAGSADLVELQWSPYAWFGPRLGRSVPWVVYAHDVWTQGEQRRLAHATEWFSPGERLLLRRMHRSRERRQLDAAAGVFAFSAKDARLIAELGARIPVQVVEPWLDPPSPGTTSRDPMCVLFTGALFRHENADACRWLLREVWPRVKEQQERARLVLAGEGPPDDVRRAAQDAPDVQVTGWVDELNDLYEEAGVFVAPLRLGAGLKFKVPQAMLHGLPVVSTTIGAEGLVEEAPDGAFAAVTDDPLEFAAAIIRCLQHPSAAAETGRTAQRWAAARFGFSRSTQRVEELYSTLVAGDHAP